MGAKPNFKPDLAQVEALASDGLSQAQICLVLGISENTLYRHKKHNTQFRDALKRGQACGVAEVTGALKSNAMDGNTAAQIFYLKNRDPDNWKDRREYESPVPEKTVVEISMVGVQPTDTDDDG